MKHYNHKKIEKKWQKTWEKEGLYKAHDFSEKPKYYCLVEFPYPSGEGLHAGHPRSYTALDIIARKRRMEGYEVLYPMGFDAFGLPAENYAIKAGIHPKIITEKNIKNFTRQMKSIGFSFDWDRALATTDTEYYRWTQWIFLKMFEQGLAYKAKFPINWCPKCKIGLANEEAAGGRCERCQSIVEKKEKDQWMLKITKYAQRLIDDLDNVDYAEQIKTQQKNWIGRSEGTLIKFLISNLPRRLPAGRQGKAGSQFPISPSTGLPAFASPFAKATEDKKASADKRPPSPVKGEGSSSLSSLSLDGRGDGGEGGYLEVFTTRPDTLFGATFMVVAPEHDIISNLKPASPAGRSQISNIDEVAKYIEKARRKSDLERTDALKEKTGVEIKGVKAINPVNGKEIPIFVADYVFTGYGTGAIMAVPAHDQRDFEFAKKYGLPIVQVIKPLTPAPLPASPAGRPQGEREKKEDDLKFSSPLAGEGVRLGRTGEGAYEDIENGIMVNSAQFNGMSVKECIKKITAWLEEKKIGKATVNYKLRDWVFSRQHYWGEPIPLVYCEQCKNKKQKVLMIHGFEGSGEGNWFPWMKRELEKNGFEVFAPSMSTSAHPSVVQWIKELRPYIERMDDGDIVVGHSLGSKAALHLIEKTKKLVGSLYLIASAIGDVESRDWERLRKEWRGSDISSLKKFWEEPIHFNVIDRYAGKKVIILSDDDPYIKRKTHDGIPGHWDFRLWSGFGHLTQEKAPELFEAIFESRHTGWVVIPEDRLPVKLPDVKKYKPTDTGESPLAKIEKWVNTTCPRCGEPARRETDVMPNWAGSNWYYLAYLMRGISNFQFPISKYSEIFKYWMPVDWYNGGLEHTTLHLLYSRFVYKFLWDIWAVPKEIGSEPFKKRTSHGMILGAGGEKMSKSRGNVINPDDVINEFGADVLRLYEMFIGPFGEAVAWDTKGILGIKRFLDRVWGYSQKFEINSKFEIRNPDIKRLLHQTIKKVSDDIEAMRFNTAISALMIFFNEMQKVESVGVKYFEIFLFLLSPFAPHRCEEIWREILGHKESISKEPWPQYNSQQLISPKTQIVIQVNGKVRDKIMMPADMDEKRVIEKALESERVAKFVEKENIIKTVYVQGKILSIVVK